MSSGTPLPTLSRCNSSCGSMALSTEVAFISCHRTSERAEDQARVAQTYFTFGASNLSVIGSLADAALELHSSPTSCANDRRPLKYSSRTSDLLAERNARTLSPVFGLLHVV